MPELVYNKLNKALEHQIYGYSRWNHHDYKESIAGYFKRRFNSYVDEKWVIYSPSVMYSVSLFSKNFKQRQG